MGRLYSIKWGEDQRFYRAQVEKEIDEETYIARYVDYGNDDVSILTLKEIKKNREFMFRRLILL